MEPRDYADQTNSRSGASLRASFQSPSSSWEELALSIAAHDLGLRGFYTEPVPARLIPEVSAAFRTGDAHTFFTRLGRAIYRTCGSKFHMDARHFMMLDSATLVFRTVADASGASSPTGKGRKPGGATEAVVPPQGEPVEHVLRLRGHSAIISGWCWGLGAGGSRSGTPSSWSPRYDSSPEVGPLTLKAGVGTGAAAGAGLGAGAASSTGKLVHFGDGGTVRRNSHAAAASAAASSHSDSNNTNTRRRSTRSSSAGTKRHHRPSSTSRSGAGGSVRRPQSFHLSRRALEATAETTTNIDSGRTSPASGDGGDSHSDTSDPRESRRGANTFPGNDGDSSPSQSPQQAQQQQQQAGGGKQRRKSYVTFIPSRDSPGPPMIAAESPTTAASLGTSDEQNTSMHAWASPEQPGGAGAAAGDGSADAQDTANANAIANAIANGTSSSPHGVDSDTDSNLSPAASPPGGMAAHDDDDDGAQAAAAAAAAGHNQSRRIQELHSAGDSIVLTSFDASEEAHRHHMLHSDRDDGDGDGALGATATGLDNSHDVLVEAANSDSSGDTAPQLPATTHDAGDASLELDIAAIAAAAAASAVSFIGGHGDADQAARDQELLGDTNAYHPDNGTPRVVARAKGSKATPRLPSRARAGSNASGGSSPMPTAEPEFDPESREMVRARHHHYHPDRQPAASALKSGDAGSRTSRSRSRSRSRSQSRDGGAPRQTLAQRGAAGSESPHVRFKNVEVHDFDLEYDEEGNPWHPTVHLGPHEIGKGHVRMMDTFEMQREATRRPRELYQRTGRMTPSRKQELVAQAQALFAESMGLPAPNPSSPRAGTGGAGGGAGADAEESAPPQPLLSPVPGSTSDPQLWADLDAIEDQLKAARGESAAPTATSGDASVHRDWSGAPVGNSSGDPFSDMVDTMESMEGTGGTMSGTMKLSGAFGGSGGSTRSGGDASDSDSVVEEHIEVQQDPGADGGSRGATPRLAGGRGGADPGVRPQLALHTRRASARRGGPAGGTPTGLRQPALAVKVVSPQPRRSARFGKRPPRVRSASLARRQQQHHVPPSARRSAGTPQTTSTRVARQAGGGAQGATGGTSVSAPRILSAGRNRRTSNRVASLRRSQFKRASSDPAVIGMKSPKRDVAAAAGGGGGGTKAQEQLARMSSGGGSGGGHVAVGGLTPHTPPKNLKHASLGIGGSALQERRALAAALDMTVPGPLATASAGPRSSLRRGGGGGSGRPRRHTDAETASVARDVEGVGSAAGGGGAAVAAAAVAAGGRATSAGRARRNTEPVPMESHTTASETLALGRAAGASTAASGAAPPTVHRWWVNPDTLALCKPGWHSSHLVHLDAAARVAYTASGAQYRLGIADVGKMRKLYRVETESELLGVLSRKVG